MEQLVAFEVIFTKLNIPAIIIPIKNYRLEKLQKNKSFGNQLKYYRIKNNLTQKQLSNKINVSRDTVMSIENKDKQFYNVETINRILSIIDKNQELNIKDEYIKFILSNPNEKIRLYREKYNLNKTEFAKLMKVNRKTIRSWENNTHTISKEKTLQFENIINIMNKQ